MGVFTDQYTAWDQAPTGRTLLIAAAAVDAMGTTAVPGAVLVDNSRIEASGTPQSIGPVEGAHIITLPDDCLLPGLVNAHTHLDLSGRGPMPPEPDFRHWLAKVRAMRAQATDTTITAAVRRGIDLARAGGTVAVGDIVAHPSAPTIAALGQSNLRGVAFIEQFGLGARQQCAIDTFNALQHQRAPSNRMQLGCSPHAPYSCTKRVFEAAARTGLPVATHLAESQGELECLEHGTGPTRALLLEDVGLPESALPLLHAHPVPALIEHLRGALCVHLNCIDSSHAALLRDAGAIACLCPRATAYFAREVPGPLDILRSAGVPIVLGTDSLLCLDTPDRICMLDELRQLQPHADAFDLLAMVTTQAAAALRMDPALVDLRPGPTAGIISVPLRQAPATARAALDDVLTSAAGPRWAIDAP
ncbi:MAG: amidohydrolase family protein [Phycisphaerales bacterium]|nr:amidohydrolase family protein [Phycisphaerales bacterium]